MKQLELPFLPEYVEIPLSKRGKHAGLYKAIVSYEDRGLAKSSWHVLFGSHGYIWKQYATQKRNGIKVALHRVIMSRMLERELSTDEQVDHINGNGLDNRRGNLRLATGSQNQANRPTTKNNTSGYKGVSWHKKSKKWSARIRVHGKRISLGHYHTPEEAHKVYCAAADKYFGEFANYG